jgi:hypothetical protein
VIVFATALPSPESGAGDEAARIYQNKSVDVSALYAHGDRNADAERGEALFPR